MGKHKDNSVAVLPSANGDEYVGALPEEAESSGPTLATDTIDEAAEIDTTTVDIEDLQPVNEAAPESAAVPTLEGALAAVPSFDETFAALGPEQCGRLFDLTSHLQEATDSKGKAQEYVNIAVEEAQFLLGEFNRLGGNYVRANAVALIDNACAIMGVPPGYKATGFLKVAGLVKLLRSNPGEKPTDKREYADSDFPPDDWFGGNITFDTLRKLTPQIAIASKKTECDTWEFAAGMESHVRGTYDLLRAGNYSQGQALAFIDFQADLIKREAAQKADEGLTDQQRRDKETLRLHREREAKYSKLRNMLSDAAEFGRDELKTSKEYIRDTLVSMGIIPPLPDLTMKGMAIVMTPGDAKELVQLLASDASKIEVFRAINREVVNIVTRKTTQADGTKLTAKAG